MKKVTSIHTVLIAVFIVALATLTVGAVTPTLPGTGSNNGGSGNDSISKPPITVIYTPKPNPLRPNAPSKQQIQSVYTAGKLSIRFAYSEGNCLLRMYNKETGLLSEYPFDSNEEEIIIPIGYIKDATLQILTNEGKIYEGELSL